MPSNQKDDVIGKWSIEKLELLRKYLAAYLKILTNQPWCRGYEYIDAFAGTGKPKTRDEQSYVNGSPRIALGLNPPFTQYHFIEQTDWRVERLMELRGEFVDRNIAVCLRGYDLIWRERRCGSTCPANRHAPFAAHCRASYAMGAANRLIQFHPSYLGLRSQAKIRQRHYRAILASNPDPHLDDRDSR